MWVTTVFSHQSHVCLTLGMWNVSWLILCPFPSRCIWPPCLHRQRSGGSWKVGGVWPTDHRPIGGGAFTVLHHLHPQGEQHGGIQEDRLSLNWSPSVNPWAVHSINHCPVLPRCLPLCPIFCPRRTQIPLFVFQLHLSCSEECGSSLLCLHWCKYFS